MYVVVDWAVNTGAAIAHPPHTLENSAAGSTAEHIISWNAAFSTAAQSHTHSLLQHAHRVCEKHTYVSFCLGLVCLSVDR